ncbi:MAG: aldo/keto reductase [Clostridia bacterium]|nr:aldo/keto reductase [Clostridia bacterium]
MINKSDIFELGIGTWKIDYENIENDMQSLIHSYNLGQNYLALSMLYNNGEVVRQMKKFIDKVDRDKLFIATNLEPTIECKDDIEKQLNEYLQILDIEYVDMFQLHKPSFSKIPLIDVYKEIQRLKLLGKVKYIGISNASLEQLFLINKEVKVDFFEGIYNLECKIYEDIKVLDYCNKNDIKFLCYQPLRRNRTAKRNYPLLVELASKYNKTQNQIILNWIINEKKMITLIKSTNINRINENKQALDFKMDMEDYERLNNFRSEEFDNVKVDWNDNGGISIDQLANQFE